MAQVGFGEAADQQIRQRVEAVIAWAYAHEAEQAVYAHAGFTVASEIIFISTPT